MKKCRKCNTYKPVDRFYADRNNKDGRRNFCIECDKTYKRSDVAKANNHRYYHSDKGKAAERRYRTGEKYKETSKAYSQSFNRILQRMKRGSEYVKKYLRTPKGKQTQKEYRNSSKRIAYREEYRKRPEVKKKERIYGLRNVHKRSAIAKKLPHTFTDKDWEYALDYFGRRCVYCGKRSNRLERDHFIPLTAGGGYIPENIVPACKKCNTSKHNNLPEKWCSPAVIEIIRIFFASIRR